MEFNTARGLRFQNKPEYSGKMFLTDFEEDKAKQVIARMEAALKKLPLYYVMSGAYAQDAQAGEQVLQDIANDNPELYLYGLKANMARDLYFVSPTGRNRGNQIYREILGAILARAINSDSERWLPVFRHILQVWPHSKYWSVVNDVLCRAYEDIEASDAECIRVIAQGLLRDPYSWRAAFDAMMSRAKRFPGETTAQFGEVFNFLDIYGQEVTGRDGISIPQDIYSRQDSTIQQAFEAQSDEMKQELRDLGAITLGANNKISRYLSRMFGTTGSNEDIGDLEALYRTDPEAAKRKVQTDFNVRNIVGWNKLHSPEIVTWMGERMADPSYSMFEKQILGYRLSLFRRNQNPGQNVEASQVAREILDGYRPINDSDLEFILAGCFRMLALASDSRYSIDPPAILSDMITLLTRHSKMEVSQRDMVDKKNRGALWHNMISNYSLSDAIQMALASIINSTDLNSPEAVRKTFKVIADTFSPLELNNPRVLRDAVPHEEIRRVLKHLLALDRGTMRFGADFFFLRLTLPKILDALEAITIQEIYDRHYREIVGHFHIYCSTLDDNSRRSIRDSYDRIIGIINKFPQIVGG